MKNYLILILCQFLITVLFSQSWTAYESIPADPKINGFSLFSIADKGYLLGGSNGIFSEPSAYNNIVYQYDPTTDSWAEFGNFPGSNAVYANATSHNGKAYYGFGYAGSGNALNDLWEFDPSSNSWTELSSCPCEGRAEIAMVALNNIIYVGFGDNFTTTQYSDWWAYDIINDTWEEKQSFPGQSRHHPQYFALNDKIYVGLGHDDAIGDLESFYSYSPEDDSWSQLNDFPTSIQGPGGQFTYQGEGYIAFGLNSFGFETPNTGEFWKYDPSMDSWTELESYSGNGYLSPLLFFINEVAYMVTESNYWNGAGSTDFNKFDFNTTSIKTELEAIEEINIYPNPNNGLFEINMPSFTFAEVINLDGKILDKLYSRNVDIQNLETGTYLLRVVGNEGVEVKKLVIKR